MPESNEQTISTLEQLAELFPEPSERSIVKETDYLTDAYQRWLEQATFFTIASHSAPQENTVQNIDCSPRGDAAGSLIKIVDDKTLLIPDRKGNNRLDTLRNLIAKPDIALLFLTPGINEALRIKGTAQISKDPELCALFDGKFKPAIVVIKVSIRSVYFQCSRAAARSGLWNIDTHQQRSDLPSAGEMLVSAGAAIDAEHYDTDLQERLKEM